MILLQWSKLVLSLTESMKIKFQWGELELVIIRNRGLDPVFFTKGYKSTTHFIFMNKIQKLPDQELKVLTIEVLTKLNPLAVESRL